MHILYLSRVRLNPYVDLLARGVQNADADIRIMQRPTLTWRRILLDRRWRILHLHWIELQYAYGPTDHARAQHDLDILLRQLAHLQKHGRKIVYTVHNINHHEGQHPDLNQRANQWLFTHADAIHVHNRMTARQVKQRYNREQAVHVIPHGNYIGVYPNEISRQEARERLKIPPHHFVYLYLGQIRPYKGLDALIAAFLKNDSPDATLILAGQINDEGCKQRLKRLAGEHPRIRLIPKFIPGDDIQTYCNAADICVLPYRDATTSGAALLAFSFGKPIIAPAIGPFPELLGDHQRGLLFDPETQDLAAVLTTARNADLARMGDGALDFARERNWTDIGAMHARVYRRLMAAGQ